MKLMKNQVPQKLPKSNKIIYFGTSEFAVPALRYLLQNRYEVTAVITQPEKPVGRAKVVMPSPVKKAALEAGIPVFEPHNLKVDEEFFQRFKDLDPAVCIVAAYGKIIPLSYLELPEFGFINIHPSELPKYRGPSPIQSAILNGDEETAVTIMKMDEQVDHGPILAMKEFSILNFKFSKYKELEVKLAELGGELLLETLPKYLSGVFKPQEQNHSVATFTKLISRGDGRIEWSQTSQEIFNQIRAFNPEPGTWTMWNGKTLNIVEAESSGIETDKIYGTTFNVNNQIAVASSKCYLILKQIQLEGGKKMDAKAFVNGHPDFLNSKLE